VIAYGCHSGNGQRNMPIIDADADIRKFPELWRISMYVFHRATRCVCGYIHQPGEVTHCWMRTYGQPTPHGLLVIKSVSFSVCNKCNKLMV